MIISMIAAVDAHMGIGKYGKIPWYLPNDFQHFKSLTIGKPVVIGRRTFEGLGRTLPDRTNIVLTHGTKSPYHDLDYEIANTVQQAIELAGDAEELMIAGGASIYKLFMPFANRLYITTVNGSFACDTHFPEITLHDWRMIHSEAHGADLYNYYSYKYVTFQKRTSSAH